MVINRSTTRSSFSILYNTDIQVRHLCAFTVFGKFKITLLPVLLLLLPLVIVGQTAPVYGDGPPSMEYDIDRDGVQNDRDTCLHSPPTAVPIAYGCSAVEIVANPDIVGEPVELALDRAINGIRRDLENLWVAIGWTPLQ